MATRRLEVEYTAENRVNDVYAQEQYRKLSERETATGPKKKC